MWSEVMNSVEQVSFSLFVFIFFWLANFCASLYNNVELKGESFDWKKLLSGVARICGIVCSLYFLTVGITLIPHSLSGGGIILSEEFTSTCNVAIIISIIPTATTTYGIKTIKVIKEIFTGTVTITEK